VEETIKTGAILMAEGTLLPASLECEGESFTPGWSWVKNHDSNGMDRLIGQAGWSFFYIAGGIEMIAFGADEKQVAGKAIKRIIASLKAKNFNCLEITHVAAKRFLGLPYVRVSAHSRHVQKSRTLFAD
jgi:hypothetical protein